MTLDDLLVKWRWSIVVHSWSDYRSEFSDWASYVGVGWQRIIMDLFVMSIAKGHNACMLQSVTLLVWGGGTVSLKSHMHCKFFLPYVLYNDEHHVKTCQYRLSPRSKKEHKVIFLLDYLIHTRQHQRDTLELRCLEGILNKPKQTFPLLRDKKR